MNEKVNIYDKINRVKLAIMATNFTKSGDNEFAGFQYFELKDFLPFVIHECAKEGLFTHCTFSQNEATFSIIDTSTKAEVIFTSPFVIPTGQKRNAIQDIGATHTFMRRYMYILAFDIVENDSFDAVVGKSNKNQLKSAIRQAVDPSEFDQILLGINMENDLQTVHELKRQLADKAKKMNINFNKQTNQFEKVGI